MTARRARARQPKLARGEMNQLESAYAKELTHSPDVAEWVFEGMKFRIGKGAWYTPDFLVVRSVSLAVEYHEVKGSWAARGQQAARVRVKSAASRYPMFRFLGVTRDKRGAWVYEEIEP